MFKYCFIVIDGDVWSKLSVAGCGVYGSFTECRLCVTIIIWIRRG